MAAPDRPLSFLCENGHVGLSSPFRAVFVLRSAWALLNSESAKPRSGIGKTVQIWGLPGWINARFVKISVFQVKIGKGIQCRWRRGADTNRSSESPIAQLRPIRSGDLCAAFKCRHIRSKTAQFAEFKVSDPCHVCSVFIWCCSSASSLIRSWLSPPGEKCKR